MKPKKMGTIINHEYVSVIQIIDESTMKWKTICPVLDTPNAISAKKKQLTKKGYKNLWVYNCLSGRKMI